jgi:hypothetical protein
MDCINPTGAASAAAAAASDLGDISLGDSHLPDVFAANLILTSGAALFGDPFGDPFGDADLHRGLRSIQCLNDEMRELRYV